MRLSSVSAMYRVPRWDNAMALAASRVARTAAHLTRWWSIPGTWQWMGRPATIRTWRVSETWKQEGKTTTSWIRYVKGTANIASGNYCCCCCFFFKVCGQKVFVYAAYWKSPKVILRNLIWLIKFLQDMHTPTGNSLNLRVSKCCGNKRNLRNTFLRTIFRRDCWWHVIYASRPLNAP